LECVGVELLYLSSTVISASHLLQESFWGKAAAMGDDFKNRG
jgi:hypothetical protein